MIKNDIFEKQNEKHMLDILYAQRHYYNIANILDNINILLTFFVCVFDFLEINNPIIKLLVNGVCGVIIYIITHIIKDCVKKGADLKKYFDYKLYAFEGITKQFENNCKKNIYNVLQKHNRSYQQQISNDGNSRPPGLKNWYFDERETQRLNIIKSTQSQNIKWDEKISKIYLIIVISLMVLSFVAYSITCTLMRFNTIEFFAGLISFVSFFYYLSEKIVSYFEINKYVYCAKILLNKAKNDTDLLEIQEIIDKRRHENFCPLNIIHKVISKSFHEEIKYISEK